MAFDPITFAAVVNSTAPIGSLERVISSFNDPKYLSGNQVFNKDDYPDLSSQIAGGFKGDVWQKKTISSIQSDYSIAPSVVGSLAHSWQAGAVTYFLTSTGNGTTGGAYLYKMIDANSEPVFVKYITYPVNFGYTAYSVIGSKLYISYYNKTYVIYDLATDPELDTPINKTLPSSAQFASYLFASGNGITMAVVGSPGAACGTAGASFKSTDGEVSWAAPTLVAGMHPTAAAGQLIFANGVFVIIAATTATGNYAYTTTGNSWAGGMMSPATARSGLVFDPVRSVFMAFPTTAGGVIMESTNGSTWTVGGTCPVANTSGIPVKLASNNTIVCGLSMKTVGANTSVATTTDGLNFTVYSSASNTDSNLDISTTFMNDKIVKFSTKGTNTLSVNFANVTDITTWTTPVSLHRTLVTNFNATCYGDNILLMDGLFPSVQMLASKIWNGMVSNDNGNTWVNTAISSGNDQVFWGGVVPTPNGFFAIGKVGTQNSVGNLVFAKSIDGIDWTYVNTNGTVASINYVNNMSCNTNGVIVVSVNNGSKILRSANYGATWVLIDVATSSSYMGFVQSIGNGFVFLSSTTSPISTGLAKWSADGITWASPGSVPSLTAMLPIALASGKQGINNICVAIMGRSGSALRDIMYSLNGGANWVLATMPATASQTSPVGVVIMNETVIIPLANGYVMRTSDITNTSVWEISDVLIDTGAALNYNFAQVSTGNNNDMVMYSAQTISQQFIVRGLTEDSNFRRVPYIPSDIPNTKWVIKAK